MKCFCCFKKYSILFVRNSMNTIEKTLKYHELLMVRNLKETIDFQLPEGFSFAFWDGENCIEDWVNIHLETGEFNSLEEAYDAFHAFYDKFYEELSTRCIFVENSNGEKVATATVSPASEYGYKCVIDWFAVSPKAQGQKLSKPLLAKTLETAKKLGYKKILLHTQTHTWLAAKIYLDFGFVPFKTKNNIGWDILKTLTNHQSLKKFKTLDNESLYDELVLKIKNELDKLHKNYNYSVWYINNRNDVYVREESNFYEYKYEIENDKIKLVRIK